MDSLRLILDALFMDVAPRTRPKVHDDLVDLKHSFLSAIDRELGGEMSTQDMIDRYVESPDVFESVAADALIQAGIPDNDRIVELAREYLGQAEALAPPAARVFDHADDTEPPSTIPGILYEEDDV